MPQETVKVANGAEALFIESPQFNTSLISFNFYLPINPQRTAEFALLPFMLTSCGKNYPDFSRLNFCLSKLYGANLFGSAEKVGDFMLLKIGISVISDSFALDGEKISENAVKLLFDLIFNPKAENGEFCAEDLEREKKKAIEHIKGEMSEKRTYSKQRLIEEMFKFEPYGTPKCGRVNEVAAITGKSLYKAWEDMLDTAFIRINVISKKTPAGLREKITETLSEYKRENVCESLISEIKKPADSPVTVTEKMEVAQGKLCMGFTSLIRGNDKQTAALTVMTDVFGGGPYSGLFTNVREKMSLCYYCSAAPVKVKGIITVSSGIEAENAEKAQEAILNELEVVKNGTFEESRLEASKKSIVDSLRTYGDSQNLIDAWYGLKIENRPVYSPEETAEFIKAVTREDVIKAANGVRLHTVYRLLPRDKEGDR